jgi:hypothetical protein
MAAGAMWCCAGPMQLKCLDLAEDANDLVAAYPAFRAGTIEAKASFPAPSRTRLRTRAIGPDGQFSRALAALALGRHGRPRRQWAMLRINRVLGYEPAEHWHNYEFPISGWAGLKSCRGPAVAGIDFLWFGLLVRAELVERCGAAT